MSAEEDAGVRAPAAAIASFIGDALGAVAVPAGDAAKIAALMTEADLTGADAHGVFRLPQYVNRVKSGGFNPRAHIKVERTGRQPRWSTATTVSVTW